jgi:GH35 family endo-1,4-beta-xylanase
MEKLTSRVRMFIAAIAVAAAPSLLLTTSAPASTAPAAAASTGLAAAISPGDVSSLSGTQLTNMMNGIAASGATWVRLGAQWAAAEPSSGVYSWNAYDPAIQAAVAAGLQVLFCINGGNAPLPSWAASPSANLNTFASQYAAFAKAAVQRYSVSPFNIHTYEIWNEPNLGSNWGGTASGTQYATVLKSAYSAIKTADASSFVISGGLSPAGNDGTDVSPQTFLTEMYLAGAGGYFDAVGAHPYCFPADPTDSSSASWSFFYNLPNWIYQVMVANGDGAKKVWMTEFGDPTGTDTSDGAVSVQTQAQQLTDAFNSLKQWSWAGPLFWYNWQDGTDPTSIYDNFGLVDASGNPKPALSAFEAEAQSLDTSSSDPPSVPNAPTSLAAAVSSSTVTLSWANPSGAQGDNVYRDGTKIASPGLVTSYQNTNVAAGSHTYYVTAYNSAGESVPSASVAVSRVTQNKHQTRLIQHILNGRH